MSVRDRFLYQKPTDEMVGLIRRVREACFSLAGLLEAAPMEPRCRALAITKLEEVSMWANKGIVFADKKE